VLQYIWRFRSGHTFKDKYTPHVIFDNYAAVYGCVVDGIANIRDKYTKDTISCFYVATSTYIFKKTINNCLYESSMFNKLHN
jgi:hypothetical protein